LLISICLSVSEKGHRSSILRGDPVGLFPVEDRANAFKQNARDLSNGHTGRADNLAAAFDERCAELTSD
jgi:hypothetical protein